MKNVVVSRFLGFCSFGNLLASIFNHSSNKHSFNLQLNTGVQILCGFQLHSTPVSLHKGSVIRLTRKRSFWFAVGPSSYVSQRRWTILDKSRFDLGHHKNINGHTITRE